MAKDWTFPVPRPSVGRKRQYAVAPPRSPMRTGLRRAILAIGSGIITGAVTISPALSKPQTEPFPFVLKSAVVTAFDERATPPLLTVRDREGATEQRMSLVGPNIPPSYRGLVTSSWSRPCALAEGDQVRVAHAGGLPLAVMEGAQQTGPESTSWRLCFVRTYFDLPTPAPPAAVPNEMVYGLGTSLGLISQGRTTTPVWIRSPADSVLAPYVRTTFMRDSAAARGQPQLAVSVEALRDLRTRLSSRIVLARVIAFRYASSAEQPVGGAGRTSSLRF